MRAASSSKLCMQTRLHHQQTSTIKQEAPPRAVKRVSAVEDDEPIQLYAMVRDPRVPTLIRHRTGHGTQSPNCVCSLTTAGLLRRWPARGGQRDLRQRAGARPRAVGDRARARKGGEQRRGGGGAARRGAGGEARGAMLAERLVARAAAKERSCMQVDLARAGGHRFQGGGRTSTHTTC